jgi:hypothetical protein
MPAPKPEVPPTADDPAESQRFIDMAREVGVDESPEAMERAFAKVSRSKTERSVQVQAASRRSGSDQ